MRIVSWNCGGWSCGGFTTEKFNEMKQFKPEILLIQECTKKEFVKVSRGDDWFNCHLRTFDFSNLDEDYYDKEFGLWYGDNDEKSNKGLAIIAPNYDIELVDNFNSKFRYFIPYKISSHLARLLGSKEETILVQFKNPPPMAVVMY